MTLLHRVASILSWIFRRSRAEAELDEELRSYIETSAAEKVRAGVVSNLQDARRLARIELGGVEQTKEHVRTERHGHLLDEVGRDLHYSLRMFVRQPGFTAVVLLTLALGIGFNTAIFSLIDALLLRSLPVKNPQELVLVNLRDRSSLDAGGDSLSYAMARALDEQRDIFSSAGGFTGMTFDAGAPGFVRRLHGGVVTGSFYETLGLQPAAGRLLTRDDDSPGAAPAAVISDSYWAREFGRSPSAIGQLIRLNGSSAVIVGVTPFGFSGATVGQIADVTVPVAALPAVKPSMAEVIGPGNSWLRVLARPAIGISAAGAAARLNAVWPSMANAVIAPQWPAARRKAVTESVFVFEPGATGWTFLRGIYERPLLVLMAVAGIVLLIACANVASLFLARATSRRREIAVRLAIGAGRARIVRQLLIEGATLSCAGAALGVLVAWAAARVVVDLMSTGPFDVVVNLAPNWHVLLFAAGLATLTGLVFGLAPAFQSRRTGPALAMKDDARTGTRPSKLLPWLATVQVALSLVLVAGAGLFVRTLANLQHVDSGFSADGVFVIDLERGQQPAPDQLLDVVRRVPGVLTAGIATHTPFDGSSWSEAIVPVGQPMPQNDNARIIGAGPGFLEALAIPLVSGRAFATKDTSDAPAVAVINERYATRYFPTQSPLGRHLVSTLMGQKADLEIVGVVKNTATSLRRQPPAIVYVPFAQFGSKQSPSLAVRAAGGSAVAEAIRSAVQAQLPNAPIEVHALASQLSGTIVQERLTATLAAGFGVLALVLSSVGLYGLLAYSVAQRSREIGIRMALGATGAGVVGDVLIGGIRVVGIGVLVGYPAAWAASRSVSSMLFGLQPADPSTMAAAIALLAGAGLLAAFVPARRASRVDPLVALRQE
jgi:predicted permease